MFGILIDVRWKGWLIIVGVVLDVEMLQDRLNASSLLLIALLGARRFGVQAAFG